MDPTVQPFGMALTLSPSYAAAAAPAAANGPAGFDLAGVWRVDRWESAAMGALLIIGLALFVNAADS